MPHPETVAPQPAAAGPSTDPFDPHAGAYGPHLAAAFAPVADESVASELPLVAGRVPPDLNGVYLRTGPNPRFPPPGRYHPFDGDGMVHAAQFERGRVTVRNRWVRTDGWHDEDRAGQALYRGIRETLVGRADRPLKDSANTDLVPHAGKVLALWYMAGDAYEIEPVTLHTLGKSGAIAAGDGHISAHAKADVHSGELMFFDYGLEPPYMHYGVLGRDGQLVHRVPVDLPGPRLPHDMAITEHHSVLHDLPLFHDAGALALGRHKIDFHAELPARFGVIPRHGAGSDIRWFEFSPCFVYHVVNAWEEGDWLVMVGCRYLPSRDADGRIDGPRTARRVAELVMDARLWRWRMNLRTGACDEACLDQVHNVEFPSVPASLLGRRTRYGYFADQRDDVVLQWNGLRKICLDSGQTLAAWADSREHSWYSEPWFAPADGNRGGSDDEDHGYLVAFQFDAARRRSTLDVFDARRIGSGPVAQLLLPRHVPVGFHGCWVGAAPPR